MGKFNLIEVAAMPAAASENTLGDVFGPNLANRRCSERRTVIGRLECSLEELAEIPKPVSADEGGTKADARQCKARGLKGTAARHKSFEPLGTARWKDRLPRSRPNCLTGPNRRRSSATHG